MSALVWLMEVLYLLVTEDFLVMAVFETVKKRLFSALFDFENGVIGSF